MKNQRMNKQKQVHQVFLQNNEMLKKSASVIVFVFVLKFEVYLRKMFVVGYLTATSCLKVYYIF
jgi:hypothetical protein